MGRDLRELVNGIAVIIDDEINRQGSEISTIRKTLEEKNIPCIVYNQIPNGDYDIKVFSQASFIILDWDFSNLEEINLSLIQEEFKNGVGDRVVLGDTRKEGDTDEVVNFIRRTLDELFVPVFIFSSLLPEHIEGILANREVSNERIFIEQKNNLVEGNDLFLKIEGWLRGNPPIYALKAWEKVIDDAKTRMFSEWENISPNWVSCIWERVKGDVQEYNFEFGSFLTRNIINRAFPFDFDESIMSKESSDVANDTKEGLGKLLEGERYLEYSDEFQPNQVYTGDLFKREEREDSDKVVYYLNIRAQCDIARNNYKDKNQGEDKNSSSYDPKLYVIKGEALGEVDLTTNPSHTGLKSILYKGIFLEKSTETIIACVDKCIAIKFNLAEFEVKYYSELEEHRIGRIMPPYITKIQQKIAQFMIREGVMPIPDALIKPLKNKHPEKK